MEALATGRPVVSCAVSGVPELVRDGETGLLVPPDDPAALAGRGRAARGDPALRARLGAQGARWSSGSTIRIATPDGWSSCWRASPPPGTSRRPVAALATAEPARRFARDGLAARLDGRDRPARRRRLRTLIARALRLRCPRCGQDALYAGGRDARALSGVRAALRARAGLLRRSDLRELRAHGGASAWAACCCSTSCFGLSLAAAARRSRCRWHAARAAARSSATPAACGSGSAISPDRSTSVRSAPPGARRPPTGRLRQSGARLGAQAHGRRPTSRSQVGLVAAMVVAADAEVAVDQDEAVAVRDR